MAPAAPACRAQAAGPSGSPGPAGGERGAEPALRGRNQLSAAAGAPRQRSEQRPPARRGRGRAGQGKAVSWSQEGRRQAKLGIKIEMRSRAVLGQPRFRLKDSSTPGGIL